jgi:PBSX family phage terminase large subunit
MSEILGSSFRYIRGIGEAHIGPHVCDVVSANNEMAETKIRGMTVAKWLGDEVTLWPKSVFKMLLSRMSVSGAVGFGTTNTDSPYHWLKTDFIDRESELNLKVFNFSINDNPFLPPGFVSDLKMEYTGLWHKRFIDGLWVMAEGAIYDMFDEAVHVGDYANLKFKNYAVGCDYGTTNPMVFVLVGWDDPNDLYIVREHYFDSKKQGRQKTDEQYVTDYIRWIGATRSHGMYVDPSAASFIRAARNKNIRVIQARNDVSDGIRVVSSFLSGGRLHVDRRCRNTIKEFSSYVWDAKAQEKGEDKPLKINDHAMDATRYVLFTRFGRGGSAKVERL